MWKLISMVKVKNMLIGFISILALLTSCMGEKKAEPEKHIIPDNYTGVIVLICNHPKGYPKKYEEKSRVYDIDKSGVLVTQFDCNYGVHKDTRESITFYYSNGNQIPYKIFTNIEHSVKANDPSSNEIQAYSYINGTVGTTEFKSYIIDTYDNREKYNDKEINGQMEYVAEMISLYVNDNN